MKPKIKINKISSFLSILVSSATIPIVAIKCVGGDVIVINNYTDTNKREAITRSLEDEENVTRKDVALATNNLLNVESSANTPKSRRARSISRQDTSYQSKERKPKGNTHLKTKQSDTSKSLKCSKNSRNNRKSSPNKCKKGNKQKQTSSKGKGESERNCGGGKRNTTSGANSIG